MAGSPPQVVCCRLCNERHSLPQQLGNTAITGLLLHTYITRPADPSKSSCQWCPKPFAGGWGRSIWNPELTSAVTSECQQHNSHAMIHLDHIGLAAWQRDILGVGVYSVQDAATQTASASSRQGWCRQSWHMDTHTHVVAAAVCTHQAVAASPGSCQGTIHRWVCMCQQHKKTAHPSHLGGPAAAKLRV